VIGFYLLIVLTTPLKYILIPWAIAGLAVSWWRPQWFVWFIVASTLLFIVGAMLLLSYAGDPAVDGDGTTFFGAAMAVGAFLVVGFLTFIVGGATALLRLRHRDRMAADLETI
jgi:hypothetical protein